MKKILFFGVAMLLVFCCIACTVNGKPQQVELAVFAAASMTETLNTVKDMYEEANPGVTILLNLDSSGTLKTQIAEGAVCDVFISAGQKQVNQLDGAASSEVNPEGLDLVLQGSRVDLLENRVTLCVSEGNEKRISSFEALVSHLADGDILFCMGNSDVPVGQYTSKILNYYGLNEEDLVQSGVITYGTNVKEVTTQLVEASVDAGVIYCTDAFSAGLMPVAYATKEMCGQVVYPACIMKGSSHEAEAKAFLDYLQAAEAMEVFASVGFSPAG